MSIIMNRVSDRASSATLNSARAKGWLLLAMLLISSSSPRRCSSSSTFLPVGSRNRSTSIVLRWPGLTFLSLPLCFLIAASVSGDSLKPYFTMNFTARTMRVASSVKVLSGLDGHFITPSCRSRSPQPVRSMISALSGPFAKSINRHMSVLKVNSRRLASSSMVAFSTTSGLYPPSV